VESEAVAAWSNSISKANLVLAMEFDRIMEEDVPFHGIFGSSEGATMEFS